MIGLAVGTRLLLQVIIMEVIEFKSLEIRFLKKKEMDRHLKVCIAAPGSYGNIIKIMRCVEGDRSDC